VIQPASTKLIWKRQPNSRHCFVCGLESEVGLRLRFDDNGADEVHAQITVRRQYQGYPGVVHGGIVAALLDEIGGRVTMSANPDRFMVTAKLDLKYRKPVPVETPLMLTARLIRDRGRLAETHAELRLPDGSVAAEAVVTLAQIPSNYSPGGDLDALGWQVYPDDDSAAE
jgi:uncharacterized protein (TIGR00369 family)